MQNSDQHHSPLIPLHCLNCNTFLNEADHFCPACGQKKADLRDHSVWHLLLESIGDFFHFDSKFFRTLGDLLVRPGFLTLEFLRGKRARYFQPFKMFLFISVLYFITAGLVEHESDTEKVAPAGSDTVVTLKNLDDMRFTFNGTNQRLFEMPVDSLKLAISHYGLNRLVNVNYPRQSWIVRLMLKQMLRNRIKGSHNLMETYSHILSRLIFVLIPVFALLLKFLYIRRKIPYYNHIIFALHTISFVFLLLWALLFLALISEWFLLLLLAGIPLYMYLAIKMVYKQGTAKTLLKWSILMGSSLLIIASFFILVASVSILLV